MAIDQLPENAGKGEVREAVRLIIALLDDFEKRLDALEFKGEVKEAEEVGQRFSEYFSGPFSPGQPLGRTVITPPKAPEWSNHEEVPQRKWTRLDDTKLKNRLGIQWPIKDLRPNHLEEIRKDDELLYSELVPQLSSEDTTPNTHV